MGFSGDTFTHLFDWEKDPQRQEKIINARLEAEFDGLDTGASALAARITSAAADIGKPYFYATGNGQTVTSGSFQKGQFSTEVLDSDGYYDNATNYRFTPLVAGVYLVGVGGGIAIDDGQIHNVGTYKNGVQQRVVSESAGATVTARPLIIDLVSLNGSTDYVEGFLFHNRGVDSTTGNVFFFALRVAA